MKVPRKEIGFLVTCLLWVLVAWLLSPLLHLDRIDTSNAKGFIYRVSFGISLMLIFFGKTLFDLIFPQHVSRKIPLLNTILLSVYALAIAAGIILMIARMIGYYIRSNRIEVPF